MKLLVLDTKVAHALDFCMRAQRDGHEVRWFVPHNEKSCKVGEGLTTVIRDYTSSLRWADLVFLSDNTVHTGIADQLRAHGVPVVGAGRKSKDWELDRVHGMQVLQAHGIEVPEYKEFNNYDDAIRFVKKNKDKRYVSKPSGDADKALSYVSKAPCDMLYMLERWKKNTKLHPPFILQECIDGIEMAVGGWFGPGGFNAGWCENFEFKKLCNGDLGCATGEQGTVLRYVESSKLASIMLKPLTKSLLDLGYVGYIDINTIIDDDGQAWPLEFTMRPGWPTFNIQQELHTGDCCQWLLDLSTGKDARNLIYDQVAIGVVMSIPDYPFSHRTGKEVCGIPVYGATSELWEHIHPAEMMLASAPAEDLRSKPMPATAGDYVLIMSAVGASVQEAKKTVYDRLKSLIIPNSPMYRTDIGERLRKQLPKLQAMGYAKGLNYSTPQAVSKELPPKASPSSKPSLMKLPNAETPMQILYV